ncbi:MULTISPECIES: two-component system QseEF-associated lipoprotein QseG [Pantoea]|uniref:Two-component system QseEF-associated lipoprotein QseG n=1 Tax=Candidatus Pantoea communis TaxID=2608354 RepID=A0ABX0RX83_9GAMM|nr:MULTISPECIES: two-component system QseEF-associated lipoprotein QseG [Pantoea]NIG21709.1 two-component system QseEF-associated lipoprotein QseG [Pantoea communis]
MKHTLIKLFSCALVAFGLSACQTPSTGSALHDGTNLPEPEVRLPDYLATDCQNVWKIETPTAMSNPLYWQRAIDCGERLSPAEARAEARRWPVQGWSRAFKQGILLANGNVTPFERRQFVDTLDGYSASYPTSVRPLLMLWRSNQAAQLALSGERSRYAALQQSHDTELDSLRQQQTKLRQSLEETQRKLERLTDIERQLSSRKPADSSDTSHGASDAQSEDQ